MVRAGMTTERVTRAAADLADEAGFEAVTVSAVARAFGAKDASVYSHIRSVHDLRARVSVMALEELADLVAAALAGRSGRDALAAVAGTYRAYATAHPGRYAASQMLMDPSAAAVDAAVRHSTLTRAMLRGYAMAEPDETDAVRLLHSAFHGYVALERSGGFQHTARSADESWSRAIDALDVMLRRWPPAAADPRGVQ